MDSFCVSIDDDAIVERIRIKTHFFALVRGHFGVGEITSGALDVTW
jgi:hypothetical protein